MKTSKEMNCVQGNNEDINKKPFSWNCLFTLHHMRKYRTLLNGKQPKATVVRKKERENKSITVVLSTNQNNLFDSLELENFW